MAGISNRTASRPRSTASMSSELTCSRNTVSSWPPRTGTGASLRGMAHPFATACEAPRIRHYRQRRCW
jgi:hypothetical protein